MKDKIKRYLKEIVFFLLFITLFSNALSLYKSMDLNKEPLHISSITTVQGLNYTLPIDKPILVHFWATWCPTCKAEADNIQTISEHFEVVTIAVNSGTDQDIKDYLLSRDLNYKVINDQDGYLSSKFNVKAFPTTIVYDKNRELVFSDVGYTSTWGLWLRMFWAGL